METIYPVKIEELKSVEMIGIGKKYPVFADMHGMGKCDNCKDPSGLVFWIEITKKGPIKFLEDEFGKVKEVHARLKSSPCSVCRPLAPDIKPAQKEEAKKEEAEEWWNV